MRILHPTFDLDAFFAGVSRAKQAVLMLDYDGTLAPFRCEPARAVPYPGVMPDLDELMAEGRTRLVVVSGRWTRDLLPLLALRERPEIWGAHGWERLMPNGSYAIGALPERVLAALVAADDWADDLAALGARAERKPASIAFHWRGRPAKDIGPIREALVERWTTMGRPPELVLVEFDGGMELRASDRNKGDVVRTLLAECGPDTALAYLGDDVTDEDAFRAIPESGAAVLVGYTLRPTTAKLWLQPPGELMMFLRRWRAARRSGSAVLVAGPAHARPGTRTR
jgi:trehalose-phosphatase